MLHTAWLVVFTVENSSAAHRSSRSSAPSTVSRMVSHCLAIGGGESDWPTADPIKASSTRQLRYFIIKVIVCWLAGLLAVVSSFSYRCAYIHLKISLATPTYREGQNTTIDNAAIYIHNQQLLVLPRAAIDVSI